MKRTDIFEAMDGLSPELVEDGEINSRSRGGRIVMTRAAKVGLAAAVAAALTVTAVAVTPLYRGTGESDSVEEGPVDEYGFKTKLITTEAYSRDFFSEEVQELIDYGIREHEALMDEEAIFDEEEPEVARKPANWDEVEQTLGIDLLDSDILDAAPPATYLIEWREEPEDGYKISSFYDYGAYALGAYREQYVDGMNVQLIAKVYIGEDGTVERQVPILDLKEEPFHTDREAVGRTITLGTGQTIYWEDYGLDQPYAYFTFRECGVEYSVNFGWDVLTGHASYDIAYDDVVLKVMESLYFADED